MNLNITRQQNEFFKKKKKLKLADISLIFKKDDPSKNLLVSKGSSFSFFLHWYQAKLLVLLTNFYRFFAAIEKDSAHNKF